MDGVEQGENMNRQSNKLPLPQLVVSDMAGTTVSDDGLVERAFVAAYRAVPELQITPQGDPRSENELRRYALDTMGQSKIAVFTELTASMEAAEAANAAFEAGYADLVRQGEAAPIAGATEAIRLLRAAGIAVVLTTGFSRETQDLLIEQLGWRDEVDAALVPADAGRGRPWPDLNLLALMRAQAESVASMVVVGDTTSDMLSGARAGAGRVVGVLTGGFSAEELKSAGATDVIESIALLPELIGLR